MSYSFFEQWSKKNNVMMQPMLELGSLHTRLWGDLTKQNFMLINDMIKTSAEQMQDISKVTGVNDLLDLQAKMAIKTAPNLLNHAEKMLDTMLDGATQYSEWFEKEWSEFSQTAQKVQKETKGSPSHKS